LRRYVQKSVSIRFVREVINMPDIKKYAAINTKIKYLEGQLLTDEDYENLLNKENVEDIMQFLKEKPVYGELLNDDIDETSHNLAEFELLLLKNIVRHYEQIILYFSGIYKKLLKSFLCRFEISDIKLLIKTAIKGEDVQSVSHSLIAFTKHATVDFNKLLQSKSLEDLIENMSQTPYYNILKPFLEESTDRQLFYMEMTLDQYYFRKLTSFIPKLEPEDRRILRKFIGSYIDLYNLQWIYRAKKLFNILPEEIYNYSLPRGYRFNEDAIKELCYLNGSNELIDKILNSKYGFLVDNIETREIYMERRSKRFLYFLLLRYKKKEQFNIMELMIYLHLLEYEMRDIISIIESHKYGYTVEHSKQFLIRKV